MDLFTPFIKDAECNSGSGDTWCSSRCMPLAHFLRVIRSSFVPHCQPLPISLSSLLSRDVIEDKIVSD